VVTSAGVVYEPVTIDPCVLMPGRDFDDLVDFWLVSVGGDGCEAGFAKEVEAHVAAAFGPLVGLFGEHGADQADDRGPVLRRSRRRRRGRLVSQDLQGFIVPVYGRIVGDAGVGGRGVGWIADERLSGAAPALDTGRIGSAA
jgi:hypothetical protein